MPYVDTAIESPTTLSLCPGIRGLERGLERVIGPVRTLAYVEIEAFIITNLLAAMETGSLAPAPVWSNLKTFPAEIFRGCVDIIMGGYPCQPFSNAGNRLGADDPRHLWPFIKNIIGIVRPACCFFENVSGHLTLGYDIVRRDLHELGYTVKEGIFSAEEVGAPHQRKRLFILAFMDDPKIFTDRIERNNERAANRTQHQFGYAGELANAYSDGPRANAGSAGRESSPDETKAQRQERDEALGQRSRCYAGNSDTDVAHSSSSSKLAEWQEQSTREELPTAERSSGVVALADTNFRGKQQRNDPGVGRIEQPDAWPARPGQQQHGWEHSRIIEPGLGCTVDGYNYREDLLRAFGNSVVEQQAAYAFETLLEEHLINDLL